MSNLSQLIEGNNCEKLDTWKEVWNTAMLSLQSLEDLHDLYSLSSLVSSLSSIYHSIPTTNDLPNEVALYTCELKLPSFFGKMLKMLSNKGLDNIHILSITTYIIGISWNFTDCSEGYCEAFCNEVTLVEVMIHYATYKLFMDRADTEQTISYLMSGVVCTIYNIVRHAQLSSYFAMESLKKSLLHLTKHSKNESLRVNSTLALAFLVDEKEKHLLQEAIGTLTVLVRVLRKAFQSSAKTVVIGSTNYSAAELLSALAVMTVNDAMCRHFIVECDGVAFIKDHADPTKGKYLADLTKIIWNILFDENNRKAVEHQMDMNAFLLHLKQQLSASAELGEYKMTVKNIDGALWLWNSGKKTAQTSEVASPSAATNSKGTLFISYCWNDKPAVLEIRKKLRDVNISCWIDVEQMQGSTLEAMANGIEQSELVLLCMSEAYKLSQSCRMEAEYAFRQNKKIVPLIMQDRYKPNGWLGILLGAKLYFDFSGRRDFQETWKMFLENLHKILHEDDVKEETVEATIGTVTQLTPHPPTSRPSKVKNGRVLNSTLLVKPPYFEWSEKQVVAWLSREDVKLSHLTAKFKDVTGDLLAELQYMMDVAPQAFYSTLAQDLKLGFLDKLKFAKALRNVNQASAK